ncbi:hypothetical protein WG66_011890 [Moniliophthora roreri]|uniref:DUF6533 domain-containing protein n=1 Tax=Moniliophthora roreri TaxID=221103 RepID=A0A0W0F3R9_MONRR|nr:hypothetical protein WG66_011890 [Moniliophthora roreri]
MDFQFEDVPTAQEILLHNYFHMLAISFLYYDHILTFGDEVKHIWKRAKIQSSYWFFLNRYLAFFGNISVTVLGFTSLDASVLVCILLTLRIYALYGQSKRILGYMVGSGSVLVALSCYVLFGQKNAPNHLGSGCHVGIERTTAIRLAGAWEALFVYDSILFSLTLYKTWTARPRRRDRVHVTSIPLLTLILRDGAIYYAVMALANLINILTFYFAGPFMRGGLSTFSSLTNPTSPESSMSVTMMSRLMLNLHRSAPCAGILSNTTTQDTMAFDSATGTSEDLDNSVELDTLGTGDFHFVSPININHERSVDSGTGSSIMKRDEEDITHHMHIRW